MPFSIWEYLRERARDAVLAGMNDALDVAEQGDTNGSQHDAAKRLASRLGGSQEQAEAKQLPSASMNGQPEASALPHPARTPAAAPQETRAEAPSRPADASTFDADLESRLNAAAAQNGRATPQEPKLTDRRPRGRPPKNRGGQS